MIVIINWKFYKKNHSINLINQEALKGDGDFDDEYSQSAKLCAFIGVSLALAALGSSLVSLIRISINEFNFNMNIIKM